MTRSWQCRRLLLALVLGVLAGFSATFAKEPEDNGRSQLQGGPALEITDKMYDEETGELLLVLRNSSDVTVTAFSVALVSAHSTGRGTTMVQGRELFPGDGIAPGASYEMKVALGFPDEPPSTFSARKVVLNHEIRSDNTSFGNSASIDRYFEERTAYFVELEEALARLRGEAGRSGVPRPVLPLLREEEARGKEARLALKDPHGRLTQRDRARMAAVSSIGNLAGQALRRIEAGHFVEQTAADLELLLESELAHASRNIRPVDLERYER